MVLDVRGVLAVRREYLTTHDARKPVGFRLVGRGTDVVVALEVLLELRVVLDRRTTIGALADHPLSHVACCACVCCVVAVVSTFKN